MTDQRVDQVTLLLKMRNDGVEVGLVVVPVGVPQLPLALAVTPKKAIL